MNNIVGIKLADGSFYPILEEGLASSKLLALTTVRDDQETVQLDLYRAIDGDEENLEYVDTLLIENLLPRAKEEPTLSLTISIDEDNVLSASIEESESGESSSLSVTLMNSSEPTQLGNPDFSLANNDPNFNLSSMSFMDDVPREESFEDFTEDSVKEDFFDDNEFEIDVPLEEPQADESLLDEPQAEDPLADESLDFNIDDAMNEGGEALGEDSFPSFSEDFNIDLEAEQIQESDFNTEELDASMPAPEFSFSDLYDKKDYTKDKKEEPNDEKKSKNKGLLFIILLLLLLAGLAFLVYFFWGKLDLFPKREKASEQRELVEENRFAAEPSVEAISQEIKTDTAKEDEIIKIEADVVVPEPVKESPPEVEAVQYKIKWGDTLWDISNAFYKTPWLYPKIADYNGIKNPDFIISGTWITIPPQ